MHNSQTPAALHAALRFVVMTEMPAEHRAVLIEVLTQAIRDQEAATLSRQTQATGGEWLEHEVAQLHSFLQEKVANSWQRADEWVMHLAAQLHRDPKSVRAKAIEVGLGAAVDYRLAKMIVRSTDA